MAIDSKKKEMIPEIKEEDFVEYAFSIIKMVIDLAEEKKTNEKYEGDLKIAQIIFDKVFCPVPFLIYISFRKLCFRCLYQKLCHVYSP